MRNSYDLNFEAIAVIFSDEYYPFLKFNTINAIYKKCPPNIGGQAYIILSHFQKDFISPRMNLLSSFRSSALIASSPFKSAAPKISASPDEADDLMMHTS